MDTKIKWKIKEISRGIVKIEVDELSKVPSIEEYKEYISQLLGIKDNKEKLLDESFSPNIAENQLLYHENDIYRVIFSGPNGEVSVGINDFKKVFKELESNNKNVKQGIDPANLEAIQAAREELFERG